MRSGRTTAEWLEALGGAVPCAPVYDVRQALENPFLAERDGVQVVDHPDRPGLKLLASPIRMGAPVPNRPRPSSGRIRPAARRARLRPCRVQALRAQGVI